MRTLIRTTTRTAQERARADLRAQIARLEHELADALIAGAPAPAPRGGRAGPRLLGLADLEAERDALSADLATVRAAAAATADAQEAARRRLEAMLARPREHRFARLALTDLGEPGCGVYMVRPRLGLIGMLAGWWQVKLSSGCPLPGFTLTQIGVRPLVRLS
ncbi:MAG TPA: hypothetical protein VGJ32_11685 [Solirubrobacteraceae bacterium]|jgi:hypothetical protein